MYFFVARYYPAYVTIDYMYAELIFCPVSGMIEQHHHLLSYEIIGFLACEFIRRTNINTNLI